MIKLIGFLFILTLGVLAHFFFDWSRHQKIFALLTAVNESTWEHIKLALGPSFLWMVIEAHLVELNNNFLLSQLVSLLAIIIFIPACYYSYYIIFKRSILVLNIIGFSFSIALGQAFSYLVYNYGNVSPLGCYFSFLGVIAIFIAYLTFTYYPPKNFLFKDPLTNKYGLDAHMDLKEIKKK